MDAFQTFCDHYKSHFHYDGTSPRKIGLEKEILVTDDKGWMADVTKHLWPYFEANGFESFSDNYYTDETIGFHFKGGQITTDAGLGTLEVILDPYESLDECDQKMKRALRYLMEAKGNQSLHILGLGMQPLTKPALENWNRKQRYEVLVERLGDDVHPATLSAADQVHIDISLDEFIPITNLMNGLAGFLIVLFSNSPLREGKPNEVYSFRELFWDDLGRDCTGVPIQPFTSPEEYLEKMWDLECTIAKQGNKFVCPRKPFREYVENFSNEELFEAFFVHEGTIWYCTRPRVFGTVEIRPTCLQPWDSMLVVPAFTLGLIENWKEVEAFMTDFEWETLRQLRYRAAEEGFRLKIGGKPVSWFLRELLDLAKTGLERRSEDTSYLEPLYARVHDEKSPADVGLELFKAGGVKALVEYASLKKKQL